MKMCWLTYLFLALVTMGPSLSFAEPFFDAHQEGWFWYQDPISEAKEKTNVQPLSARVLNPTETVMAFRKKVEDSLNLAILAPTDENLKRYANYYFETIRLGQRFTDAYKVMLLNHPQYDYTLTFPTSHPFQPTYEQQYQKRTQQKIREFSKSHGFFFFLANRCPYCHAFAPIVRQFVDKYGTSIIPISLDGGSLPEFPNVMKDNGTAKALKVYSLPSLFAVNPKNKQVVPIANGAMSLSELEENILRVVEIAEGINHE